MKFRLVLVFFLIFLIGFFVWQGIYLPKNLAFTENKLFLIERGQNLFQVAENLEKEGLIKNKFLFDFYIIITGTQRKLQAGEYYLSPSMNVTGITKKIISGDIIKEEITIIEGWNFRSIGFYFENKGMFQAEELWELAGFPAVDYSKAKDLPIPVDFSADYDFLKQKPENVGLEGYLFPDTYQINKGASIEAIVRKMLDNFDKKLAPYRNEISGSGLTLFEIVTMASLLEKEVKTKEEKEIVSGIFWKRIKERMPLDSCATIAYILGGGNWTFEEMRKEIGKGKEIDSPYNTYKYLGLPLGPICNPGLESIKAAVYPKNSEYWYYLSLPDGETIFSRTLEEHNIAQAKYLK
ncbi:MAG: endolytic transglycosylase MltG [Candidatus Nealsonbacteria bacterium]|nr:MAG: endolytic transglycosylase MltG [Candidatus Nealsonbacteria bacterium]